ncbi:MAG: hypothetical protein ACYCQK_07155, partial [Acidiferrobacteraceae bacterium]
MAASIIPNPAGFGVLTQAGDIAFFSEDAKLETDHELTVALKDHAGGFLRTYLASLDRPGLRLGAIGSVPSVREWGPVSLFLEEDIVRELYPVSGPVGSDLTSFQRRNQEKSLYRGMELLLEYRNMQYPSACV